MRVTTSPTNPASAQPGQRLQTCAHCHRTTLARGRQRYCCPACKQAAYRQRNPARSPEPTPPTAATRRAQTIYECPECETRYLELQRCPDCQLFCRRLGTGGHTPCCDELITHQELSPDSDTADATHPEPSPEGAAMP